MYPCTCHLRFVVTTVTMSQKPWKLEKGMHVREKSATFSSDGIFTLTAFKQMSSLYLN